MTALATFIVSSVTEVLQGTKLPSSFVVGAVVAAITILAYYLLHFTWRLFFVVPREVRRDAAAGVPLWNEPEEKRPPDPDTMQMQAEQIAGLIEAWRLRVEQGGDPTETEQVREAIRAFGERADTDMWLPFRSRRRSLDLYYRISGMENLYAVRAECLEFRARRPLH